MVCGFLLFEPACAHGSALWCAGPTAGRPTLDGPSPSLGLEGHGFTPLFSRSLIMADNSIGFPTTPLPARSELSVDRGTVTTSSL